MKVKNAKISVRIDPVTKNGAERIFKKLGLTASQAITLFYQQVVTQHGLPFLTLAHDDFITEIRVDDEDQTGMKTFDTIEELLEDLDSDD